MNIERPTATDEDTAEQPSPRSRQQTEHVARNIASDRRRTEIAHAVEAPGGQEEPADGAIETETSAITAGIESAAKRSRKSPEENEDAAFALSGTETSIQAYGVLDGVSAVRGVLGNGREAAQGARELIQGEVLRMPPEVRTDASVAIAHLTEAFAQIQKQFGSIQEVRPQATTASVMLVIEDPTTGKPVEVVIATLGDSPVSRIRGGKLEQLSIPQTGLQVHVEREFKNEPPDIIDAAARYARDREDPSGAKLSEEQRASIDGVRLIDRFLGAGFGVENSGEPKFIRERIEPGDCYLLETDGSTKRADGTERDPAEIVRLAAEHRDATAFAKALAGKADGHDDATVVAVRFEEAASAPPTPDRTPRRPTEATVRQTVESPPVRELPPDVAVGSITEHERARWADLPSADLQLLIRSQRDAIANAENNFPYSFSGRLPERDHPSRPTERRRSLLLADLAVRERVALAVEDILADRAAAGEMPEPSAPAASSGTEQRHRWISPTDVTRIEGLSDADRVQRQEALAQLLTRDDAVLARQLATNANSDDPERRASTATFVTHLPDRIQQKYRAGMSAEQVATLLDQARQYHREELTMILEQGAARRQLAERERAISPGTTATPVELPQPAQRTPSTEQPTADAAPQAPHPPPTPPGLFDRLRRRFLGK